MGRYPSGQRGQTVNLLSYDFTGSNPVLPTIRRGYRSRFQAPDRAKGPVTIGTHAGVAQLVEHQPSKLNVAGSNLVSRSTKKKECTGLCSSGVEHFLGKEEVTGSIPVKGSSKIA